MRRRAGRPKAAPAPPLRRILRRGGLRPPADPRRDPHHPAAERLDGAQIRGPTRAQRSGMGDPAEGGTPFAGRAGAAERTKPAACGRMRDAQLATATGEDEQGSGARNARQPRGPHKADQPCGERTNSGANETCPQGRGERCETCEDVTVRTLRGRRRAPHKEKPRPTLSF